MVGIEINEETKEKILSLGESGDSFDDIVNRLCKIAISCQNKVFIYSANNYVNIDDLIK